MSSFSARGSGRAIVRLRGQGHLSIHLGPADCVRFACDGVPRYVASGEVRISAARGCVVLEGEFLGLSFHGGVVDAIFFGEFEGPPPRAAIRTRTAA